MKKKLLSILLTFCMVLTLLPTAAFAEGNTEEELPACTCETACTAESMNADCPVCGAEGASAENCAKYIKPADDAAVQPEGEVSDPQPETALTALIGGSETVTEVNTADELTAAIAGVNFDTVKLAANISISRSLTVNRPDVTLDLNGYTLTCGDTECADIFSVNVTGNLTVKDSGTGGKIDGQNNNCGFSINGGILTLKSGTIINCMTDGDGGAVDISYGGKFEMSGGAITNCKASDDSGAVDIGDGCTFIMNSGTISGCSADDDAGAIFIKGNASFVMNGGTIENCSAGNNGGAVKMRNTSRFTMNGGTISSCTAQQGGGVYVDGGSTFTMNGGSIVGCTAATTDSNYAMGGGVYVSQGSTLTMSGGSIENCKASADGSSAFGGGIYNAGRTTLSGTAKIRNCQAANAGGGIYDYSVLNISDNVEITGCTAPLWSAMIVSGTISGGTFNGTVTSGGTITGGTFNGEVRNVGTITGGTFNGQVTNHGRITGGTFKGGITGTPALATGSGTETDPYQIGTAIGLEWFRDKVNDGEYGACAVLTADIDLNNENWTPIGIISNNSSGQGAYTGTFDGKGHTISGLNVSGELVYAGLFGAVKGGTIKNLTVAGNVSPSISQCFAGGIMGYASNAAIKNCSNHCSVTGIAGSFIGGIAGFNVDDAKIIDCYNVGTIRGINYAEVSGGIVGSNSGTISNCYNVGTVSNDNSVGEIAGHNFDTVENCYYLTGGSGSGTPMTAAQFADGTVLKLLKADRTDSPWDSECQYLAAVSRTLPVFQGQGDDHTHHWSGWTSHGDGTRTRTCDCGASETVNYSNSSSRNYYTIQATAGTGGAISPSGKVSVREGRDQVFTITPDQGYAVSDVKIDGESVGAVTSYTFENVRKAHTIAVSFAKVKVFVDVPAGSYYEDAVNWAVENGITQGTDDTHFSPDDVCTRAQMVTFLWRAAGSPKVENGKNPFTDVKADAYYYDAVLWAVEKGVTSGTSATTFSPDATVTRGQTVTFLYRNAGSPEVSGTMPFTDVEADAYYAKAVQWAVQQKITTGTSETTFSPMSDCTRGQIVTFLYRAK